MHQIMTHEQLAQSILDVGVDELSAHRRHPEAAVYALEHDGPWTSGLGRQRCVEAEHSQSGTGLRALVPRQLGIPGARTAWRGVTKTMGRCQSKWAR
jgi:hypothetical protein